MPADEPHDPVVEAAQRAWDDTDGFGFNTSRDAMEESAREALAPIREVIAQADADLAVEGLTEGRAMTVLFQAVEAIRRLSTTSEELTND